MKSFSISKAGRTYVDQAKRSGRLLRTHTCPGGQCQGSLARNDISGINKKIALVGLLLSLLLAGCTPTPVPFDQTFVTVQPDTGPTPTSTLSELYLPQVHQAIPSPTIVPSLVPTPTPILVSFVLPKGPTLIYTGQNTEMRIFWQWTDSSDFRLDWGVDETYASGSTLVQEYDPKNHLYAFTISGLKPATPYHYRVVLGKEFSAGTFRTASDSADTRLKFVSYGDTRTYPDLHDAVAKQVRDLIQSDPLYQTFSLMVGDFVNYGDDDSSWTSELFDPAFKNIHALMGNIAWLPVMGNHEGSGVLYARYFPLPFVGARYASFDYGPAHIVLLDQYVDDSPGSPQFQWLAADLSASTKKWKFVVLHEPAWSAAGGHDNNTQVQNELDPLFEKAGVAIVFAGHNHYYARAEVNGITHLTIGTGGAPLYTPVKTMPNLMTTYQGNGYARFEIDGGDLYAQFVALDGQIRDSFHLMR